MRTDYQTAVAEDENGNSDDRVHSLFGDERAVELSTRENDGNRIRSANDEAKFEVIASIRDNILNLPPERHREMIDDLATAAETRDIEYIADTITNWATGGHGSEYAGLPVNRTSKKLFGKYKDDPEMAAVWDAIEPQIAVGAYQRQAFFTCGLC